MSYLLVSLELILPQRELLKIALGLVVKVLLPLDHPAVAQALVAGILLGRLLKQAGQSVSPLPGGLEKGQVPGHSKEATSFLRVRELYIQMHQSAAFVSFSSFPFSSKNKDQALVLWVLLGILVNRDDQSVCSLPEGLRESQLFGTQKQEF